MTAPMALKSISFGRTASTTAAPSSAAPTSASISKGFGLRGTNVTDLGQFAALLRDYEAQGAAEIWNIPISDQVTSPTMRRIKIKGHGVM